MERSKFHHIFESTLAELSEHKLRVLEGVEVDAANDFARYVLNSGLCELLSQNPETNPRLLKYFPYDGSLLKSQAGELRELCCEFFRGHNKDAPGKARGVPRSEVKAIRESLEYLRERVDAVSAAESRRLIDKVGPTLRLMVPKHGAEG